MAKTNVRVKNNFFERWPCGQPFHDLVGHLIKGASPNDSCMLNVIVTVRFDPPPPLPSPLASHFLKKLNVTTYQE